MTKRPDLNVGPLPTPSESFVIRKGGVVVLTVRGESGKGIPVVCAGIPSSPQRARPYESESDVDGTQSSDDKPPAPSAQMAVAVLSRARRSGGGDARGVGRNPFPRSTGRANTYSINTLLPARLRCNMQFTGQLTAAAASVLYSGWRANDLYDPDVAIGGPELVGFSEIMAFYKNFRVLKFRLRIQPCMFTSGKILLFVGWPASVVTSSSETYTQSSGQPGALRCISFNDLSQPTAETMVQSPWITVSDLLGMDASSFDADESTWGTSTTSPTRLCYFNVTGFTNDSTNCQFAILTDIEFEAEFFNRVELTS